MADTRKTLDDLQTDFATTGAGGISAAKLRHFLLTTSVPRASMYISSSAATSTSDGAGTWKKVAGTTTSTRLTDFTMPSSNRLTYGGDASPMEFDVEISGDFTGTATDVIEFGVDDSGAGAPVAETKVRATATGGTDHFSLTTRINLSTADYLEVWCNNVADANDVTINRMQVKMTGILS